MSKYVESNLSKGETIVKKAKITRLALLGIWLKGILFFWLLLIPLIKAIVKSIKIGHIELGITNKRLVGKVGVLETEAMDAPLNKIQNIHVKQPFFGKIFKYGTLTIDTAAGTFVFPYVAQANDFKKAIMTQIDQAEEDRMQQQAQMMSRAMGGYGAPRGYGAPQGYDGYGEYDDYGGYGGYEAPRRPSGVRRPSGSAPRRPSNGYRPNGQNRPRPNGPRYR